MFDFYEKRKMRGVIFSKITAGILISLALAISYSAYGRYVAERETRDKRLESATDLEALKQHAALLEAKVGRLESDQGMEREIRTQFDVKKDNEQVVVIVDGKATTSDPSAPKIYPLPERKSLFERLIFW